MTSDSYGKESVPGCPLSLPLPSLLIRKLHQIHFVFLLTLEEKFTLETSFHNYYGTTLSVSLSFVSSYARWQLRHKKPDFRSAASDPRLDPEHLSFFLSFSYGDLGFT